jgi:hypothetical protein
MSWPDSTTSTGAGPWLTEAAAITVPCTSSARACAELPLGRSVSTTRSVRSGRKKVMPSFG